jgi:hypothetical protein
MHILTTRGIALCKHVLLLKGDPEAPTSINAQMLTRKTAEERVPCSDKNIAKAERDN